MRKGLGVGRGKGYYNIVPIDKHIHSLSAKGVKTYVRQVKPKDVGGALMVSCIRCGMTMPVYSGVTEGKNVYCGSCAKDEFDLDAKSKKYPDFKCDKCGQVLATGEYLHKLRVKGEELPDEYDMLKSHIWNCTSKEAEAYRRAKDEEMEEEGHYSEDSMYAKRYKSPEQAETEEQLDELALRYFGTRFSALKPKKKEEIRDAFREQCYRLSAQGYQTEQEKTDAFVRIVGGRAKADELYRILQNSYPRYCSLNDEYPKQHTKEEVFRASAKERGFTKKQIDAILSLQ